jgi:hypothetical protein
MKRSILKTVVLLTAVGVLVNLLRWPQTKTGVITLDALNRHEFLIHNPQHIDDYLLWRRLTNIPLIVALDTKYSETPSFAYRTNPNSGAKCIWVSQTLIGKILLIVGVEIDSPSVGFSSLAVDRSPKLPQEIPGTVRALSFPEIEQFLNNGTRAEWVVNLDLSILKHMPSLPPVLDVGELDVDGM